MPFARRIAFFASLFGAALSCHIDKLVDPPPDRVLVPSPVRLFMTSPAGSSTSLEGWTVVSSAQSDPVSWTARLAGRSPWLALEDSAGTTPDTVHLSASPADLPVGRYHDTLVISPLDRDLAALRIPVELQVGECPVTELTLPADVHDSLRDTDCGSSQRDDGFSRRYRIHGSAGDTLGIGLTSAAFDGFIRVDASPMTGGAPLAATDACSDITIDACLPALVLPADGNYLVEVTSTESGAATGGYGLTVANPRAPTPLVDLVQLRGDSATSLSTGGVVTEPAFVVAAGLRDPDPGDSLRLEVEVQRVGTPFEGTPTATGSELPAGARGVVRIVGLANGIGYHWQARARDRSGRATPWHSFGGNPESASDLRVEVAATRLAFRVHPGTPTAGNAMTPPIEVAAVDGDGQTVTSFTGGVTLALLGGTSGAVLSGDQTVSAVAGVATFPGLSINKVGSGYQLRATTTGLSEGVSDPFAVLAGVATHLTFSVQPSSTAAGRPITPAVRITAWDAQENIATGHTGNVTITIANDGSLLKNATLSGVLTAAAAGGVASFDDLSIDQAGAGFTLAATAAGLTGATSASFAISPLGGTATQQSFTTPPSDTRAGEIITPAVEVAILDALGDPVGGFTGNTTLALLDGTSGAILSGLRTVPVSAGVARFSDLSVDRPGVDFRFRATTPGLPDAIGPPFNVTAPPPATALRFSTQPPSALVVGGSFGTSVEALDANGARATGFSGEVSLTLQGGILTTLTGTTRVMAVDGVANFGDLGVSGVCVSCQLLAVASGLTGATSTSFTVVAP